MNKWRWHAWVTKVPVWFCCQTHVHFIKYFIFFKCLEESVQIYYFSHKCQEHHLLWKFILLTLDTSAYTASSNWLKASSRRVSFSVTSISIAPPGPQGLFFCLRSPSSPERKLGPVLSPSACHRTVTLQALSSHDRVPFLQVVFDSILSPNTEARWLCTLLSMQTAPSVWYHTGDIDWKPDTPKSQKDATL